MDNGMPTLLESQGAPSRDGPYLTVQPHHDSPARAHNTKTIVVAATFTADLLLKPLQFWMRTLDMAANITLAPYAQMMQELLNPTSLLSSNAHGEDVLLVRLEDWIPHGADSSGERTLQHLRTIVDELFTAVSAFRARTSAAILIYFCPFSTLLRTVHGAQLEQTQLDLVMRLRGLANTHCWTHTELVQLYPVEDYEDPQTDRIGHIPYTPEYFAAIATLLARRIAALSKPPCKVIALDCDNTLWKGVCGEDGADGVVLTPAHLEFQRLLVHQHDAGMLLCLCSKNNLSDVEEVFRCHPQMPLLAEHLICSRVNWSTKSSNLQSLARELDLSLDSFIFVDDSGFECAEVRSHCPDMLVLQFPQSPDEVTHFLNHVWAFDRLGVTQEARTRTAQYRQNRARCNAQRDAADVKKFLETLELQVEVAPIQREHLARVAELIQRTNQFNLTAVRRRSSEIDALVSSGEMRCLVAHVRDRFGDYGLVGAVLWTIRSATLAVDTFVLSCRALGRGVEHRIMNEVGGIARLQRLSHVELKYRRTERNQPAWTFLENSFGQFASLTRDSAGVVTDGIFTVPAAYTERVRAAAAREQRGAVESTRSFPVSAVHMGAGTRWHEEAYRLSRLAEIVAAIDAAAPKARRGQHEYVAPRTQREATVAQVWADVLGLDQVGIQDDFLDLGGDSLHAVRAIARMEELLGLELPIHEFFEAATVEEVARRMVDAGAFSAPIEHLQHGEPAPLSSAQQRLWFIDRMEGSAAYQIALAMRMRGQLDRASLQAALDDLLYRHTILRTVFAAVNGVPLQEITPTARFTLQFVDLTTSPVDQREARALEQSREESVAPFDLGRGPLVRGRLLQLMADEYVLLITMHHIVSDGWSVGVLMREVGALYAAHRNGCVHGLPPLSIQYVDYARWQRQELRSPVLQEQLEYWKQHLQGAAGLLELPTDRPRPAVQSYRGQGVRLMLEPAITAQLNDFSRQHKLTLAMTLWTALAIVLARLTGQTDLVIGTPVANRRRSELEAMIGLFVNTLAVRVQLGDDPKAIDLLRRVKAALLQAYAHQDVQFEQVVEALQPTRSLSHSPIFQVMFVMQPPLQELPSLPGLKLEAYEVPARTAQFDLTLSLQEVGEEVRGHLNYASDLFEHGTIERWVECLKCVLTGMVREPDRRISELPLMSEAHRRQVVESFNATQTEYPREQLIHELFEEQVARTPAAVAVVYEGASLTYAELNAKANQLARHLRQRGVSSDRLVGLCLHRSLDLIVALFGTLKAGGAYVPLDPDYPGERLAYMLHSAEPNVLITQAQLLPELSSPSCAVVLIDTEWEEIASRDRGNLQRSSLDTRPGSSDLAYVIYTSGSTGGPKGVMIEHRDVLNLWQGLESFYDASIERITLNASFNFDASVQQLVQLLSGRTLFVVPQQTRLDAARLLDFVDRHRVQGIDCTPSQLRLWVSAGLLDRQGWSLRVVLVGGEAIEPELWSVLAQYQNVAFYNVYGPTECTVDATAAPLCGDGTAPHIGRPMPNRLIYILDRHRQPVPIGVSGELYIGGAGVARGYLNRAALTAERFIADPFNGGEGRLYRTGDLGRWRADGAIEYLGRNDHQVKIRGFRIELGEIEAQLLRHAQVKEAVVLAREDVAGEKRLVAYVVPVEEGQSGPSAEELRGQLKAVLPEYMVPSAIVTLPNLPLTSSGKLDRGALPAPQLDAYVSHRYEPPQGNLERLIAEIFQELLDIERVGREDNFFELGGHSLSAMQVAGRLQTAFNINIPTRLLFSSPTLRQFCSQIEARIRIEGGAGATNEAEHSRTIAAGSPIKPYPRKVESGKLHLPTSWAQQRLWFFDQLQGGSAAYNVPVAIQLCGPLDPGVLQRALNAVIARHETLRTTFISVEGSPAQQISVAEDFALQLFDLTCHLGTCREKYVRVHEREELWAPFDLQLGPLIRGRLLRLQAEEHLLLINMHHIICDGWSVGVLIRELTALYSSLRLEGADPLPPLPVQYADYAQWQRRQLRGDLLEQQLGYWRKQLDGIATGFELPTDHPRPAIQSYRGDAVQVVIDSKLTAQLKSTARRHGLTLFMVLYAGWASLLSRLSGQEDLVIGTPVANRRRPEVDGLIGFFVNMLALRVRLPASMTVGALLTHVKETALAAYDHQDIPFEQLVELLKPERTLSRHPIFQIAIALQNTPCSELRLPDMKITRQELENDAAKLDLLLTLDERADELVGCLVYAVDLFERRTIQRWWASFTVLLQGLVHTQHGCIGDLPLLPHSERREILGLFNATCKPYPHDRLVHQLFEEHAQRNPAAPAVDSGSLCLTYAQINNRADQLARFLRSQGVGPDRLVVVHLDQRAEIVITLLGVLKAGGAYVLSDPDCPAGRLRLMLQDATPVVLLTIERLRSSLPATSALVVSLDSEWDQIARAVHESTDSERPDTKPDHLASVIYPSRSKGLPKGVLISHRGICNLAMSQLDAFEIRPQSRVLQFASLSFDALSWEWTMALCAGACLCEAGRGALTPSAGLGAALRELKITHAVVSPSVLDALSSEKGLDALQTLIVDTRTCCELSMRLWPAVRLIHRYGSVETTVCTSLHIPDACAVEGSVIGRPIANMRIYILDRRSHLLPIGVTGEIHIGGVGVAQGYLNRPGFTEQRFVHDPFCDDPQARMYRSGDFGRWRADGTVEYLGSGPSRLQSARKEKAAGRAGSHRKAYEAPQGDIEEIVAGIWQALLRVERIGRHDNFFELGGHSIMVVQMMERLHRLGLAAEVRYVFESQTLADLAVVLQMRGGASFEVPPNLIPPQCDAITPKMLPLIELAPEHIEMIARCVPGGAANIQDIYPLTPLQEGILFHHLLSERGSDTYVVVIALSVASRERLQELIEALQGTVDRYDVLRTAVLWEHLPRPIQVVYRHATLPITQIEMRPEPEPMEHIREWLKPERQRFDIRQAPLMRLQIAADARSEQWYALLQMHHMTIDHVALQIMTAEIVAQLEGRAQIFQASVPYRNYVAQALANARTGVAETYFRSKLGDVDEPTAPFGLLDVHGDGTQIEEARGQIDEDLARRVRRQARREAVSVATLLHAAWALVVAHTSGRDDVVFGSVLLGRMQGGAVAQRALGMFINALPLRLKLQNLTARELLVHTQRGLVDLMSYEQTSLVTAQRCSAVAGSTPLFSALLNYRHSMPQHSAQEWSAASGIRVLEGLERTNYPITLSLDDFGDAFSLVAQTDRRIDPRRVLTYLCTAVQSLVEALEQGAKGQALALSILPDIERSQVIELFNSTRAQYAQDALVHELFEQQVLRTPEAVAAVYDERSLTYAELNAQANQLARALRKCGIGPQRRVAICVERGLEMLVGLLAILKAGGAYVPLDPSYPSQRLQRMLEDAAPHVILTQQKLRAALPAVLTQIIVLDQQRHQWADESDANVSPADTGLVSHHPVYVIFTSGSTGRPKGIVMLHQSMVNLIEWHRADTWFGVPRRTLQFAALSFDVAFQETFSTLCTGGTLVMLDECTRRDAGALLDFLAGRSVARLFLPPLMLQSLAEAFDSTRHQPLGLEDIITAGEQLRVSPLIREFCEHMRGCRLHNHYGPTETHVVTALTLLGNPRQWPVLPTIGRPIANSRIYVLDEQRQIVPLGVAGEIYIAGANVAWGYLHRPELTTARFLQDTLGGDPQKRMYKSGDLGRWCEDGTLEYLGRNDDQVKIRGYRVELGEVEGELASCEEVKQAAVVLREEASGEKRLVAYVTSRKESSLNIERLRTHLKAALPDHMVPSEFLVLQNLPLMPNGKLDRRALPLPQSHADENIHYELPQGYIEGRLARIWQEVLGRACIGRRDNFFDIGGHSLLAMKMLLKVNQTLYCTLQLTDAYKNSTVEELAARIGGGMRSDAFVDLSCEAKLDESIVPRAGRVRSPARVVLLTGSTGFVGRFLLSQLLEDPDTAVYCLVRATSSAQASARLRAKLLQWDLWRDEFERRIVAVAGDLRDPQLGIDRVTYDALCRDVDSIYHCATSMNHLETYAMAKTANVDAVTQLLKFATCERPKPVNYISTLGVFGATLEEPTRQIEEVSSIDGETYRHSQGYLASKWVAEKLVMLASERGIPCNIFRLGLVWADTRAGRFDELQHAYRVMKSCLLSGYGIENYRFPMPPTPVDYVAQAVIYLANEHFNGQGIFHIASAEQHVGNVFSRCNEISGLSLELLPYYAWIGQMKLLHQQEQSLPAVPLIEYAFSMDEKSFQQHQRRARSAVNVRFSVERTHRELEKAGIVAPVLNDQLLRVCLRDMISRDRDLQRLDDAVRGMDL